MIRPTQASRCGLSQLSWSIRRAVLRLRSQRDCQWSSPEFDQPGTISMSASEVRMVLSRSYLARLLGSLRARPLSRERGEYAERHGDDDDEPTPIGDCRQVEIGSEQLWYQCDRHECQRRNDAKPHGAAH